MSAFGPLLQINVTLLPCTYANLRLRWLRRAARDIHRFLIVVTFRRVSLEGSVRAVV
jgi:hypothetical protein